MTLTDEIKLTNVAPGRWTTRAGPEWCNPGGGLWGGYGVGLCIRVLEHEPEAVGEALSLTVTFAAALKDGDLDIRTRRIRQGGSIGVWAGGPGGVRHEAGRSGLTRLGTAEDGPARRHRRPPFPARPRE